tara:strand:+ start:3329 stop:3892 length:564 start_codon:yes stop_codon:yes gene_type:complete
MAANIVDTVIIFRILRKLTTPFNKTAAFKAGVIDAKGNVLVKPRDRTPEQKRTITLLDRMVFNLKRLLAKVPGGKTQLGSYIAALALLKEYVDNNHNQETSQVLLEKMQDHKIIPRVKHDLSTQEGFMDAWEEAMVESMVSGASFGGAMSGAGTNAQVNATGMAGIDPVLGNKKIKRRKDLRKILDR